MLLVAVSAGSVTAVCNYVKTVPVCIFNSNKLQRASVTDCVVTMNWLCVLQMVMVAVWVASALYSSPRFIWAGTITSNLSNGLTDTICIMRRVKYDSQLFDMINFTVLYLVPLSVITALYSLIAMTLWHSSHGPERHYRTNGNAAAANSK